ncbi:MAG: hypothetical protein AAB705_03380, partial [Patescibacteria group bacterium]
MALHVYLKKKQYTARKKTVNFFSYIFLIAGAMLLFWSFYPIVSFTIYSNLFLKNNINMPISDDGVPSSLKEANSVLGTFNIFSN